MGRFVLSCEVALRLNQASLTRVTGDIKHGLEKSLSGGVLSKSVDVKVNASQIRAAQAALSGLNKTLNSTVQINQNVNASCTQAGTSIRSMVGSFAGLSLIIGVFRGASTEAYAFNEQMIRFRELSKLSAGGTEDIARGLLELASDTGTAAEALAKAYRIIRTSGQSALDSDEIIKALAVFQQTGNAGSIDETTQAILVLGNAFNQSGHEIAESLNLMSAVSSKFSVENDEIVRGLKKTGTVIANLGGSFRDYQAIFATTISKSKEDAAATGNSIRSIFQYLQRGTTRSFLLKNLGLDTRTSEGELKKPLALIREIQAALAKKSPRGELAAAFNENFGLRNSARTVSLFYSRSRLDAILAAQEKADGENDRQLAIRKETLTQKFIELNQQIVTFVYNLGQTSIVKQLGNDVIGLTQNILGLAKSLATVTDSFAGLTGGSFGPLLAGGVGAHLISTGGPLKAALGTALALSAANQLVQKSDLSKQNKDIGGSLINASLLPALAFGARGQFGKHGNAITAAALGIGAIQSGREIGNQKIEAGDNDTGRNILKSTSIGGGALIGAAAGTAGGPLGIALGALAGGIWGYTESIRSADEAIQRVKLTKSAGEANQQLDNLLSKKTPITAASIGRLHLANVEATQYGGKEGLRSNLPALEKLQDELVKTSNSFEEFVDRKGLILLSDIVALTGENFGKTVEEQKQYIATQHALNIATAAFSEQMLDITDSINKSHDHVEKRGRENSGFNFGASVDVNSIDFAGGGVLGADAQQLRLLRNSTTDIARRVKTKGIDNALDGFGFTPNIEKAVESTLEQFKESFNSPNVHAEDIAAAIGSNKRISELSSRAGAGVEGKRQEILSDEHQAALVRDLLLSADKHNANFGSSNVARNVTGADFTPKEIVDSIIAKQQQEISLEQRAQANPKDAQQLLQDRNALHTSITREKQLLDLMATSTGTLTQRFADLDKAAARLAPEKTTQEIRTFGTYEEKAELERNLMVAESLGSGQTTLNSLDPTSIKGVHAILKQYGDSPSRLFGNQTGAELEGSLIEQQTGIGSFRELAVNRAQANREQLQVEQTQKQARAGQATVANSEASIAISNLEGLNLAAKLLDSAADKLNGLTITMEATHKVEVIHNGLAAFQTMDEKFSQLVLNTVERKIDEMLVKKFPSVGNMCWQQAKKSGI